MDACAVVYLGNRRGVCNRKGLSVPFRMKVNEYSKIMTGVSNLDAHYGLRSP